MIFATANVAPLDVRCWFPTSQASNYAHKNYWPQSLVSTVIHLQPCVESFSPCAAGAQLVHPPFVDQSAESLLGLCYRPLLRKTE